jgi:3-hydroxybutyryl-CoA dehydratase
MPIIENITYNELDLGDNATLTKTLTDEELVLFAAVSGDVNPVSLDTELAKKSVYKERIGYGMWAGSLISSGLSSVIPGPGTVHLEQNLKFKKEVQMGDTLTVSLTVQEKHERHRVTMKCVVTNQNNEDVALGESIVVAPVDKVSLTEAALPRIEIES